MMKYVSWPTLLCSQVATRAADARPRTGGGLSVWMWLLGLEAVWMPLKM